MLWWNHAFIDVDACFGLLLCWEVKFPYNFSFLMEALRICANIVNDLEVFIYPSTLLKTCFSWKKPYYSTRLPPVATCPVLFGWCVVSFVCHTYILELWPKISTFVSSDYNIFVHMLLRDLMYVSASQAWLYFFVGKGFCLADLPPSPNMKNMGDYFHT